MRTWVGVGLAPAPFIWHAVTAIRVRTAGEEMSYEIRLALAWIRRAYRRDVDCDGRMTVP